MLVVILFFIELLLLFLLSRTMTKKLSHFFYSITKSKQWTISLIAFLFLPGTLIHELSHFFMAHILFVPAGHMTLIPKIEGNTVKLGSVAIARTDIFRRFLIGTAPFLFGTSILLGLLFTAAHYQLFENTLFVLIIAYAVFEIGNTMFSSKKDMEGALELTGTLLFIGILLYFAGLRIPEIDFAAFFDQEIIRESFEKGSLFLLAPLCLDVLVIATLTLFKK